MTRECVKPRGGSENEGKRGFDKPLRGKREISKYIVRSEMK